MSKSKLDPLLKYYAAAKSGWYDIKLASFSGSGRAIADSFPPTAAPRPANVMVEVEGDGNSLPTALTAAGFKPRTRAGRVFSGDIPREALHLLEEMPGLKRAEASRVLAGELDLACPDARVVEVRDSPTPHRGAGVIVGIIDHGIDHRHPSFRKADGTSRILAIWDQGLEPEAGEAAPASFGYGVEYVKSTIDEDLESAASTLKVRRKNTTSHGTHVAGIAAGNGRPEPDTGERLAGVAPEADLVVVANTRSDKDDPGSLGDSADTLDAVRYILEMADRHGKPVVINQSQGDNIGPHDGTSLLEVGIAHLMTGPGRAFIKSAGNEGDKGSHAEGTLPSSGQQDVAIAIPANQDEVIVDLWYPGANRLGVQIAPPGGTMTEVFQPLFTRRVPLSNGNRAFVDATLDDPGNGDNRIFVVFEPGNQDFLENGTWTLRLSGSGSWHAWVQIDSGATFLPPLANLARTISIPGTTDAVITVGSYATRPSLETEVGDLSVFSSRGPTRDGRQAPTLCAPGEELTAPIGLRDDGGTDEVFFGPSKGTSQSAPMVAGAAALMLEIDKSLTAADIRRCLKETARQAGNAPSNDWGAGKLDVQAVCERVSSTNS